MATLNVSDKQKQRVVEAMALVQPQWPIKLSQADTVELGMALIEEKYSNSTK